jgi:precorrin-6B methylase 1
MSRAAVLKVHFRNEETLRNLEQTAHRLGVSTDELAEGAIERELASMGAGLESKLVGILDRLKASDREVSEREVQDFARGEVDFDDPFQGRLVSTGDPHGIGALFARRVERG